ncbi:MAG TPA: hypothetical protein VG735_10770 [Caulobacterales bacterium]|nr:hypothetical protein [Caulobacterales bacterium]
MLRALALVAGLAFAGSALAAAQSSDITGAWTFQTGHFDNGCSMTGQMKIARAANGAHSCTFSTHETCANISGGAKQSCTAERKDGKLSIKSKVLSVEPTFQHYYPDDFELEIVSGAYMKGQLNSAGQAPVEFFRGDAPVS